MKLISIAIISILFLFCSVNCSEKKNNVLLSDEDMEILSRINPKKDTIYVDSLGQIWDVKVEPGSGNYTVSPR